MDTPAVETTVRIPWGPALERSLVGYPQTSEVDPAGRQSPAPPMIRVANGAVAILHWYGDRFVPAGTVRWTSSAGGGATRVHSAPDPFGTSEVTAVDFWIAADGRLVLLETIANPDGAASSRLAVLADDRVVRTQALLEGGPYVRIVPDDRGRVFLVSRRDGNTLTELNVETGALERRYTAAPGTRAALAANLGVIVPAALLEKPDPARIAAPASAPTALVYLFGVDDAGAYYTLVDGQVLAVDFGGKILRRLTLAEHPPLSPATATAPASIVTRLAPLPAWRVDGDGAVYVPKVGPDAFEVVRVRMP